MQYKQDHKSRPATPALRTLRFVLCVVLLGILTPIDGRAKPQQGLSAGVEGGSQAKKRGLQYDFTLPDKLDQEIVKKFKGRSELINYQKSRVFTEVGLRRRAKNDRKLLRDLYESYGYFEAAVDYEIRKNPRGAQEVVFHVLEGKRYRVSTVSFNILGDAQTRENLKILEETARDITQLMAQQLVDTENIFEHLEEFIRYLADHGYPYASLAGHRAYADFKNHTVRIIADLNPGPRVRFGQVRIIKKLKTVPKAFVENRCPFAPGDLYSRAQVDAYREALTEAQLFRVINFNISRGNLHEDGTQDIEAVLKEGKHRTWSAGLKYAFNEGPLVSTQWTHRNITGRADRLDLQVAIGQRERGLEVDYKLPDFLRQNQTLGLHTEGGRRETKSYTGRTYGTSFNLTNPIGRRFELEVGAGYMSSDITKSRRQFRTKSAVFPIHLTWDSRDNILDPTRGGVLKLSVTPNVGAIGQKNFFVNTNLQGSYNFPLLRDNRLARPHLLLATWARAGLVSGIKLPDLPPDHRVFMGGYGSLRGYGFQLAGPLDEEGRPEGGLAKLEGGVEPRFKINETWEAVTFLEAGALSKFSKQHVREQVFWSYGVGIRYHTPVGPLRLDIALPSKTRIRPNGKKADRPLQLYVSIGQAF